MRDHRTIFVPTLLAALVALVLTLAFGILYSSPNAMAAGVLSLTAQAAPAAVAPGSTVTYTISLSNAGSGSPHVRITDTLPSGFTFVAGSTTLSVDGVTSPYYDPVVTGQSTSWGMGPYPGARSGNIYGLHTFVQDACNGNTISKQLDQTRSLAGSGGFVKELFYGIDNSTPGPAPCWIDFVNGAYDHGLNPILRLQGSFGGPYWNKPQADAPGDFTSAANAFRRVVAGLPRRDGFTLYIEVWNEENLNAEWSGACNPVEYGQFLKQTADAIHSLGDSRIKVLNGGFSPGGDCNYLSFIDQMATVPGALAAIDVWATHPYPGNHPPEYNLHNGTASWQTNTIDTYRLELDRLQRNGRWGLRVIATEGGHDLGNNAFGWEGFAPIDETNRADYISRAFRDYWTKYPEVIGVTPFELTDPYENWDGWDWIDKDGWHHQEYDAVSGLSKPPAPVSSQLVLQFRARVPSTAGTYSSNLTAYSDDGSAVILSGAAPVQVTGPALTSTPTRTRTPTPPPTPTSTASRTATPSATATPTNTPASTWTRTATPTLTPSPAPSAFVTASATPTRTPDSCTFGVRNIITVGIHPKGIAVDPTTNRVFVGLADSSSIAVIDANTEQVIATWATDGKGISNGVAFAQNRLFISKRSMANVSVLDASTGAFLKNIAVGNLPYGIGGSGGRVWVANFGDNSVSAVNASTLGVLSTTGVSASPALVASFDTRAYVSTWDGGVVELDSNNHIVRTINTGMGTYGVAASISTGRVYASNRNTQQVGIVDASAGAIINYVSEPFAPFALAVNPAANQLYIVMPDTNQLRVRDATTLAFIADISIGLQGGDGGDTIAVLGNRVYVANYADDTVTVIGDCGNTMATATPTATRIASLTPTRTNTATRTPSATPTHTITRTPTMTRTPTQTWTPTAISTRTATPTPTITSTPPILDKQIYLPLLANESDFSSLVSSVGNNARPLIAPLVPTPVNIARSPYPRAVAADRTRGLFAFTEPGGLGVRSPDGRESHRSLDGEIRALAIDEARGQILATNVDRGSVQVMDESAQALLGEITGLDHPSGLALNGSRLFVAETGADRIAVIDLATATIVRRVPVDHAPYAVVVNPANGFVYAGQAGASSVTVLNSAGDIQTSIELGGLGLVQGLAVNPNTNRIYAVYFIGPRFHAIAEIDSATNQVIARIGGDYALPLTNAYGITIDAERNRLYLNDRGGLVEIDGLTHKAMPIQSVSSIGYAFGLAFDAYSKQLLSGGILSRSVSSFRAP